MLTALLNSQHFVQFLGVIRRVCGQTLARVRVSWTYISIIIISLQQTKG